MRAIMVMFDSLKRHFLEPYGTTKGRVNAVKAIMVQYRLGVEENVPAGDLIRNRARLTWDGGEVEMDPIDVRVYKTEDDRMI